MIRYGGKEFVEAMIHLKLGDKWKIIEQKKFLYQASELEPTNASIGEVFNKNLQVEHSENASQESTS